MPLPPLIQLAGFILRNLVPAVAAIIVAIVRVIGFLIELGVGIGKAIGRLVGFQLAMVGFVRDGVEAVIKAVASLPGRIIDLGGKMLDAGKSIMGKFLDGLKGVGSFCVGHR